MEIRHPEFLPFHLPPTPVFACAGPLPLEKRSAV
jgi:hypothetical protein